MPRVTSTATGAPSATLFEGPGEMRALLRATDWSRTPLGPPDRWPRSLRTMAGVVLGSRFPMLLWWGPRLLQLYNDAYRPILGAKHPGSVAAPGSEVWSEIWHIIGPQAEGVLAGGPATWNEHLLLPMLRKGFLEETYFTFSYSPVPGDDGQLGGVLVTCQETTEQVQDDRQLRTLRDLAAGAASSESEEEACERAACILAANDADVPFAGIYVVERDGRTARLAGRAGFGDGDAPGSLPAEIALDAPRRAASWPLAEARDRGAPVIVADLGPFGPLPRGRWSAAPAQGAVVPLARPGVPLPYGFLVCGLSPLRPFDERYRGFFALVADQLATALANVRTFAEEQRRRRALEELDRAKTAFFSNVSHELRTPLTLMLGPTEDALALPEGKLAGDALRAVHRNQLRLLKLVNSLLDFARIEAGRVEPLLERTDVAALVREVAEAFRPAVERAGLRFEVEAPRPVDAAVDREMFEKILLNLLSNALKYTLSGEIRVALSAAGGAVELSVTDTGAGIAREEQARIFERFHRVEGTPARTVEGSGIGLALVAELARIHGGSAAVRSAPGEGSRFTVTLPAQAVAGRPEPVAGRPAGAQGARLYVEEALGWLGERAAPPPAGEAPGATEGERILVAEDNADMRAYLRTVLAPHWIVEFEADGARALEAARARRPDLVLTDVMMPGLDGFALLRALRAEEPTRDVPVVMLSARAGEEARVEGLEAGADDYVVKPFGARELAARIRAQLALARTRRALDAQRAALYALFEQAPTPICVLRGETLVFEMANTVYRRLVGREDLLGKSFADALPELSGTRFEPLLRDVLRTRQSYVGRETLVRLARGPGGALEDTWWTFVYAPFAGDRGDAERVMVLASEVTEQVRARNDLVAASRAKDEFLAVLGHELRNPLSPMVTALQLMRLRQPDALVGERTVLERQVGHMTRLVDDLLDVSRITAGKVQLHRQPVDLADAVAQAIEIAGPLIEERRHRLSVDVVRGLRVDADPARLAQILSNLLTNAARYTPPGGHVRVAGRSEAGQVVVSVADDGQGIDAELLARVFEPFVQGQRSAERTSAGLGLGLPIVRSLTALHGGTVEARSAGPGQGSEFVVRLPMLPASAAEEEPSEGRSAPADGHRRVLVVDDNRDAADTLAEALETLGHEARCAYDGLEALEAARRFDPEVVLLDLGLPALDGYEVARRLREEGVRGRLVALTGYGQESDRRRSREAGFERHLVKPIRLDDLSELLT
jgi:signal transduction histidine kinase/ActR/RegA family two-component response regulator